MLHLAIRKELFWDIDQNRLDEEKNRSLIVERVLSYGTLQELNVIFKYYGKEVIAELARKLGYLDPKTLAFIVSYLGIRKSEIKCLTRKQSNRQHWD